MAGSMQIADDMGFRVELERPPSRIVSLVPSWTETLFALGFSSEVVGVTKFCVVPGAVESILRLGRALGREPQAAALAKEITLSVSGIEAALGVWSKLRLRVF